MINRLYSRYRADKGRWMNENKPCFKQCRSAPVYSLYYLTMMAKREVNRAAEWLTVRACVIKKHSWWLAAPCHLLPVLAMSLSLGNWFTMYSYTAFDSSLNRSLICFTVQRAPVYHIETYFG